MRAPFALFRGFLLLSLVACQPDGGDGDTDLSESGALNPCPADGLCTLAGTDVSLSADDLAPFGEIVGDAKVVGLGEAVHRSGGFLQMKSRLARYLIEELGFRTLAIETEWSRADIVSDYLETCEGSPEDVVLEGIRETWRAQSVADLLAWLCEFNSEYPSDPVHFFGFNNYQPWDDGAALIALAEALESPDVAGPLIEGIETCEGVTSTDEDEWLSGFSGTVSETDYAACIDAMDAVHSVFKAKRADLDLTHTEEELALLELNFTSLRGWEDYYYYYGGLSPNPVGYSSRDAAMAEIFTTLWELRYPDEQVVFFSHNGHVKRGSDTVETVYPEIAAEGDVLEGTVRMGNHLEAALGEDYVPIGLLCYECAMRDDYVTVLPDELESPTGNELMHTGLHARNEEFLLVDLETRSDTPLFEPQAVYGYTVVMSSNLVGIQEAVPADLYRAVVYLEDSGPWNGL